jgi:hypothetical protein
LLELFFFLELIHDARNDEHKIYRTRISCYKQRVHTIGILVFQIGCVRECVAVVCGMLAHSFVIKVIGILKILCVCVCVYDSG